jgi:hypothetical protein
MRVSEFYHVVDPRHATCMPLCLFEEWGWRRYVCVRDIRSWDGRARTNTSCCCLPAHGCWTHVSPSAPLFPSRKGERTSLILELISVFKDPLSPIWHSVTCQWLHGPCLINLTEASSFPNVHCYSRMGSIITTPSGAQKFHWTFTKLLAHAEFFFRLFHLGRF